MGMDTQVGESARDPLASIHFGEGSPKYLTRYRSRATWFVFCAPDVLLPVRQSKISSYLRLSGVCARNFGKNSGRETHLRVVTTGSMSEHLHGFGMGCHDLAWKIFGQGYHENARTQDSEPFAFEQPCPFQSFATNRVEELLTIRGQI